MSSTCTHIERTTAKVVVAVEMQMIVAINLSSQLTSATERTSIAPACKVERALSDDTYRVVQHESIVICTTVEMTT